MTQLRLKTLIAGLLAIAGLCVVANVRAPDASVHGQIMASLGNLQAIDSELDEVVLKLRNGLLGSYDPVVEALRRINADRRDLERGRYALGRSGRGEFNAGMETLAATLAEKESLIERFKSRNAVLRNSLHYLPRAADALERDALTPRALRTGAHELTRDLLLLHLGSTITDPEALDMRISRLREQLAAQPPAVRDNADVFLRHAQQLLHEQARLDRLVQSIATTSVRRPAAALAEAYHAAYERRSLEANVYRFVLLLVSLALILYVAFFAIDRRVRPAARATGGAI